MSYDGDADSSSLELSTTSDDLGVFDFDPCLISTTDDYYDDGGSSDHLNLRQTIAIPIPRKKLITEYPSIFAKQVKPKSNLISKMDEVIKEFKSLPDAKMIPLRQKCFDQIKGFDQSKLKRQKTTNDEATSIVSWLYSWL